MGQVSNLTQTMYKVYLKYSKEIKDFKTHAESVDMANRYVQEKTRLWLSPVFDNKS